MTIGSTNFRTSTFTRHAESSGHKSAVLGEKLQPDFAKAVSKVVSEKEAAALAVTAPIHTSDCERGFSTQNLIKSGQRNRLSPERVDDLILVCREGGQIQTFDFQSALSHWKTKKNRGVYSTNDNLI